MAFALREASLIKSFPNAGIWNLVLVVCIGIQHLCRVGVVADDKFIILVKMMYGKMSAFSRLVSDVAWGPRPIPADFSQTYCRRSVSQRG